MLKCIYSDASLNGQSKHCECVSTVRPDTYSGYWNFKCDVGRDVLCVELTNVLLIVPTVLLCFASSVVSVSFLKR